MPARESPLLPETTIFAPFPFRTLPFGLSWQYTMAGSRIPRTRQRRCSCALPAWRRVPLAGVPAPPCPASRARDCGRTPGAYVVLDHRQQLRGFCKRHALRRPARAFLSVLARQLVPDEKIPVRLYAVLACCVLTIPNARKRTLGCRRHVLPSSQKSSPAIAPLFWSMQGEK